MVRDFFFAQSGDRCAKLRRYIAGFFAVGGSIPFNRR